MPSGKLNGDGEFFFAPELFEGLYHSELVNVLPEHTDARPAHTHARQEHSDALPERKEDGLPERADALPQHTA